MIRSVVCGVSEAHGDDGALAVAAGLAERTGARLAVVLVQPDADDPHDLANLETCADFALVRAASRHGVTDGASFRVEFGDPAKALAGVAASLDADVIVIGGSRRYGLGALVGGTVMDHLIDIARQPLIVVPPGSGGRFKSGIGLGGSLICGVTGEDGEVATFAAGLAHELGVDPLFVRTAATSPAGGLASLESVADRRRACGIVVRSDTRSWIARAIRGSVCRALCRNGRRPVVLVPQAR
jgi:nucleotide-binding universal stress UspA family protein